MNRNSTEENVLPETSLITLVGAPNSGKTTLFNYLSGQRHKTVNYPGATVEYSVSKFLKYYDINANLLDSPGIISLNPSSLDEKVSIDSLYSHPVYGKPKFLIVTVDSCQLSRHLFLVLQLIQKGYDIIVALTMSDLLKSKGYEVSQKELSEYLKCKVVNINGRTGEGIDDLIDNIRTYLLSNGKINSDHSEKIKHKLKETEILKLFKLTDEIENKVLYPIEGNKKNDKIDEVNRKLNILNNNNRFSNKPDKNTIKLDRIFLHKYWGLVIFLLVMAITFTSIFWLASPLMSVVDITFTYLSDKTLLILGETWYGHLLSDGIITGMGSVLVFLPQIIILFFILGVLEDTGYLARGAMLVDKPLSKIGLNGRSFVPMLSGFACAIPAIMAARTIQNKKERFLTIFIIPLMSCSARLPVYSLLLAFLFPKRPFICGIILASIYLFGILSSVIISGIVNKFQYRLLKVKDNSSFIIELPTYRIPKYRFVFNHTLKNANQYLRKAGPIILIFSTVLWFLTHFPLQNTTEINGNLNDNKQIIEAQNQISHSYAATLGKILEPVMKPIGLDWRVGVSLITTFAAREVFVSSLALIFKVSGNGDNLQNSILSALKDAKNEDSGSQMFTTATIIGLIVFFIFSLQCISTLAVTRKETGGWRLPLIQLALYTSTAYILTFITVNGLRLIGVN
jgi:ferrous iron transport protein B